MAAETGPTGSTYISGTMIDGVKILTANLGFSTVSSSMKVFPGDCDNQK